MMLKPELCEAIAGGRVIRFYYEGGFRSAEPYIYGLSKDEVEYVLVYQISGVSSSAKPEGWKRLRVEKIDQLNVAAETFAENQPDYDPADVVIKRVYCQI
jgi:hypothetical protein